MSNERDTVAQMMIRLSVCFVLLIGLSATAFAEEFRDWSNNSGKSISAELKEVEGDVVTLRVPNGRTYKVSLLDLSEADRNYTAQWLEDRAKAARMEEAGIELGNPTELIVETAFDQVTPRTRKAEIQGWQAGIGEWRIEEGALIGDELPEDNHASSLTHRFEAKGLIITAEVQLGTAEQIAFACRDTVPPNLHLGRLYITADKLWIQHMSGIAKTTKAERLVTKDVDLDPEKWYNVTIEIIGDQYRAKVGDEEIEATHSRFADSKGIVALVNKGQGAKYRNVALWHAVEKE